MADSTVWWLIAGVAVAAELLTGTFVLLMLAIGLSAGALAAHAGASLTLQLVAAAVVGGGAVAAWYARRSRRPRGPAAGANRNVNLDVGATVQIEAWNSDGTATVKYRGASWSAVAARPDAPRASGSHRIREVIGSQLVVEKI